MIIVVTKRKIMNNNKQRNKIVFINLTVSTTEEFSMRWTKILRKYRHIINTFGNKVLRGTQDPRSKF